MRLLTLPPLVLLFAGCTRSAEPGAHADVAILRTAIAEWQEGPTDGRICLDARVQQQKRGESTSEHPVRWAAVVLDSLARDTLIAVDPKTIAEGYVGRRCTPDQQRSHLAISLPSGEQDTVHVLTVATTSASVAREGLVAYAALVLARRHGNWSVIERAGMQFDALPRAR